jgi:hypothetical protein
MKPIPLGAFVPPVTGTMGRPGAVASNLYDSSGNFRERSSSFKRRRVGGERELDDAFDITRPYPPLTNPPKPFFDIESIQALMVDATSKAEFIRSTVDDPTVDNPTRQFAIANLSMFALLTAVVEKAVMPLAYSPPPTWNRQSAETPPVAAKPIPGKKELTDALIAAEKTAVIFDAELGSASVGNKERLAHAFSATVKAKAVAVAEGGGGSSEEVAAAVAEAVRAADDALSCASDMTFLGQATKAYNNSRKADDPRNGTFFTMPIKLEFPDKSSRIHFERVMREKCKIKAAMSLPFGIRKEAEKVRNIALELFPGEIVMVRAESDGQKFAVFHKKDGEKKWIRSSDTYPIPVSAVLPEQGGGPDGMDG